LPSSRDLAEQLQVSRTVVLLAYDQLLAEGFVQGRHGSGTYVCKGVTAKTQGSGGKGAKVRVSRFGVSAEAAVSRGPSARSDSKVMRYDFSYRRPPVERFPFETWQRILTRKSRSAPVRMLDYASPAGSLDLRAAIAAHLRRSRAVQCEASQVIIVNGSQQALDLAARVLLERGDDAVIEDPNYQGARDAFLAAGARLHPVQVDNEGLIPSQLPKRARLAFVTPSHQFPTGTILSLGRRMALLDWAKRTGAVVIEDDYDGEFRYEGRPVESMQGLDRDGRVIYVGTFSRTIFPALRIGYLIAPTTLVKALTAAKWLCDRHTATLEQETLAEFIATGAYERHLRRSRRANAIRVHAFSAGGSSRETRGTMSPRLSESVTQRKGCAIVVEVAWRCGTDEGVFVVLVVVPRRVEANVLHKFVAKRTHRLVVRELQRPKGLGRIENGLITLAAGQAISEHRGETLYGLESHGGAAVVSVVDVVGAD
jgi:GntR family transcriptional regulator / MocR family aminotransferase